MWSQHIQSIETRICRHFYSVDERKVNKHGIWIVWNSLQPERLDWSVESGMSTIHCHILYVSSFVTQRISSVSFFKLNNKWVMCSDMRHSNEQSLRIIDVLNNLERSYRISTPICVYKTLKLMTWVSASSIMMVFNQNLLHTLSITNSDNFLRKHNHLITRTLNMNTV